jgi:hypothetical protein
LISKHNSFVVFLLSNIGNKDMILLTNCLTTKIKREDVSDENTDYFVNARNNGISLSSIAIKVSIVLFSA